MLLVVVLSVFLAGVAAGAERASAPLEVKGFLLGGSKTELLEKFPFLACSADTYFYTLKTCDIERERRCPARLVTSDFKIGDIPITWLVSLKDERVTRITLVAGSANFEELVGALVSKFGKPTSSTVAMLENAFGAKFDDHTMIWKRGTGEVRAMQRFGKMSLSAVSFSTPEAARQDALDVLRRASKAASGL